MFGLRRRRWGKSSLLKFGVNLNLKGNDTLNFPRFLKVDSSEDVRQLE